MDEYEQRQRNRYEKVLMHYSQHPNSTFKECWRETGVTPNIARGLLEKGVPKLSLRPVKHVLREETQADAQSFTTQTLNKIRQANVAAATQLMTQMHAKIKTMEFSPSGEPQPNGGVRCDSAEFKRVVAALKQVNDMLGEMLPKQVPDAPEAVSDHIEDAENRHAVNEELDAFMEKFGGALSEIYGTGNEQQVVAATHKRQHEKQA